MMMRAPIFGLVALVVVSLPGAATRAQTGDSETCIGDWAQASTIVEQRKMVDVAELSKWAHEKYAGKIISTRLCHAGAVYFYRLVMRDQEGRIQRLKVDGAALSP